MLDRVFGGSTAKTIVMSTSGNLTLQTRMENASMYTNVVLQEEFFLELRVKDRVAVEFQKVRFYLHEMEFLKIRLERYFVELHWKLKSHMLTKTLCISYTGLRSIDFEYQESFEMEGSVVQEIVKQFMCSEIMFVFKKTIAIYNIESPEGTSLVVENHTKIGDLAFSMLRRNMKTATEGGFSKFDFLVDRKERRLSICGRCDGISVTHLMPIYIE